MLKRQPKRRPLAEALSLSKLTECSSDLSRLLTQAENLNRFELIFEQLLPDFLKGQLHINYIDQHGLVITCASATLATRFRMTERQIVERLNRQTGLSIRKVKLKIRPKSLQKANIETKRTISKRNAQLLESEAGHTQDDKLRQVLLRLAARGESET